MSSSDAFMCALKQVGIYVLVGLASDCENCAVQYQNAPTCYPVELKRRGEYIIQQFSKYENVIGYSAGNEVGLSAGEEPLGNLPCQKQFLRDMKAYVHKCSTDPVAKMRNIPIGLAYADNQRTFKTQYYHCNTDPSTDVNNFQVPDFLGLNAYLYCNGNETDSTNLIGYEQLLGDIQSYSLSVPLMLTEYGCLNPTFPSKDGYNSQRTFLQVKTLFSSTFRTEFIGGFIFEYSTEKIYSETTSPYPFTNYGPGKFMKI